MINVNWCYECIVAQQLYITTDIIVLVVENCLIVLVVETKETQDNNKRRQKYSLFYVCIYFIY